MSSMGVILKNHNKSLLETVEESATVRQCNCRDKPNCPLQRHCLATSSVYQADVMNEDGSSHIYFGLAEGEFKTRWKNHRQSFRTEKYKNETELSKLVWDLKDKNIQFEINWKIVAKCKSYATCV